MKKYETTFIIDSAQKSDELQSTISKVESFIKNHGGNILNEEDWGKKRLAYEINRKQYGNYHHFLFEGPETLPGLLEREYRLDESILRYLTVVADPRNYPETEVKNDTAEAAAEPQPATAEPQPATAEPEEPKPTASVAEAETASATETSTEPDSSDQSDSDKDEN